MRKRKSRRRRMKTRVRRRRSMRSRQTDRQTGRQKKDNTAIIIIKTFDQHNNLTKHLTDNSGEDDV